MLTIFTKPVLRFTAVFLTILLVSELVIPLSMYALTSGPSQPEFSSFEPVATTNMVDNFTGSFNYNLPVIEIPGPHGSSYPLSLSYHSGSTPEEEASWVGYGWNINPGAINRSVRGYPDDDLGVKIEHYMNTGLDYTVTLKAIATPEISSTKFGIAGSLSLRLNNHKGFGYGVGIEANYDGFASVGFNVEDGNSSFTAKVDPVKILFSEANPNNRETNQSAEDVTEQTTTETEKPLTEEQKRDKAIVKQALTSVGQMAFSYASSLLTSPSYPIPMQEFEGYSVEAALGITGALSISPIPPIGGHTGYTGTYSSHKTKDKTSLAYGYIYSGIAQNVKTASLDEVERNQVSMDYYKERYAPHLAHKKYMPIPFSNPDAFSVSGEGVGGSFRFHNRQIGDYLPQNSTSKRLEFGLSAEVTIGTEFGPSPKLSIGSMGMTVDKPSSKRYPKPNQTSIPFTFKNFATDAPYRDFENKYVNGNVASVDNAVFPRFTGDLGGCVIYDQQLNKLTSPSTDGNLQYATILTPEEFDITNLNNPRKDLNRMNMTQETNPTGLLRSARSGMSSNIAYNTIGSMKKHPNFCYTKDEETRSQFIIDNPSSTFTPEESLEFLPDNAIGEFAIYLPDGKCYVYGLPVLARKEKKENTFEKAGSDKHTGEFREKPYVTKYLLTQILTPDYVDIDGNGPSDNDLGGWIKFSYRRGVAKVGNDWSAWSKWRTPYSGTYDEKNKISDKNDDVFSYSEGEKQVYILARVETQTHIAEFITNKLYMNTLSRSGYYAGSGLERADAFQAGFQDLDHLIINQQFQYHNPEYYNFSEYLEKINLYSKSDGNSSETPIKTVCFEYNYESYTQRTNPGDGRPNTPYLPNSVRNTIPNTSNPVRRKSTHEGKLTLKKVWFEYGGVINARISPYIFEYVYPNVGNSVIESKYPGVLTYGNAGSEVEYERPDYCQNGQDAWGYYSDKPDLIAQRNKNGMRWLKQTKNKIDPAPCYLKVIKLPSGGEIRVQYEGHDYQYVQDRPAMAMVSLSSQNISTNKYFLNTSDDLGITLTATSPADVTAYQAALNKLAEKIRSQFKDKEKIAFTFLTAFGSQADNPTTLNETNYETVAVPDNDREYVHGYCDLDQVGVETDPATGRLGVYIVLGNSPRDIADEYYKTNISGKRSSFEKGNILENIKSLIGLGDELLFLNNTPHVGFFNHFSYFRIPLTQPKKAGGCRVKRVLMYDKGDVEGEGGSVLYGQEYIYKTIDEKYYNNEPQIISSGVATNEPSQMNQENPLVTFLEGYNDNMFFDTPVAGENLEQYEGPIGESILPGPSIGYSKVITKNIHSGKTAPGFTVNEYYTYRDKDAAYSKNVKFTSINSKMDMAPIHLPLYFINIDQFGEYKSQGYCFTISSLPGHIKSTAQYKWEFTSMPDFINLMNSSPLESVEYEYFEKGELLPQFQDENTIIRDSKSFNGIEMDIAKEENLFQEESDSYSGELDFGLGILGFVPFPYLGFSPPKIRINHTHLHSSVLSKVINYPTVLKKTITKRDGMIHTVENIAFSPYTGNPVVKMVTDEFDGTRPASQNTNLTGTTVLYEIPAASKYKSMGQKSENERFALPKSLFSIIYSLSPGNQPTTILRIEKSNSPLYPGDIIMFLGKYIKRNERYLLSMVVNGINQNTHEIGSTDNNIQYVLQGLRNDKYKADGDIMDILGDVSKIVVVRSGKTNQLSAVTSTISLYGKTKDEVLSTSLSALADDGVLAASATTYSDNWNYSWVGGYPSTQDTNAYETGRRGKWRPLATYVYRDETVPGVGTNNRVYGNSGVTATNTSGSYTGSFQNFAWNGTIDPRWLNTNTVVHYSKHGEPVEEQDINGIYSSARFAHHEAVPSIIASNANYLNMYFESFEDNTNGYNLKAHTGFYSFTCTSTNHTFTLPPIQDAQDYIVKLWSTSETPPTISGGNMNLVARSGEWILYEKILSLAASTTVTISQNVSESNPEFLDDIRIQPKNAQSTCYVYDNTNLRLLAQFDDQHFASIFQYNTEGKLIRKIKETTRGIKTVAETDYNTPKIVRPTLGRRDIDWGQSRPAGGAPQSKTTDKGVLNEGIKRLRQTDPMVSSMNKTMKQKDQLVSVPVRAQQRIDSLNVKAKQKMDDLKSKNVNGLNEIIKYNPDDRVTNMLLRASKTVVDTIPLLKAKLLNIHATPEKLNAKVIGMDTIKVVQPKNNDKK